MAAGGSQTLVGHGYAGHKSGPKDRRSDEDPHGDHGHVQVIDSQEESPDDVEDSRLATVLGVAALPDATSDKSRNCIHWTVLTMIWLAGTAGRRVYRHQWSHLTLDLRAQAWCPKGAASPRADVFQNGVRVLSFVRCAECVGVGTEQTSQVP